MKLKRSKRFLVFLLVPLLLSVNIGLTSGGNKMLAESHAPAEMYVPHTTDSHGAFLPDWTRITFSLFPTIARGGSIDLSNLAGVLSYDPSRTWQAGSSITSILMLGDLANVTNLPIRSLKSILKTVGLPLGSLKLADFGLVAQQTIQSLIKAIPGLSGLPLKSVKPLYDLVSSTLVAGSLANLPIGQLQKNPLLANLPLDKLNLANYALNSIPGLINTPLNQFAKWGETLIGEIPGLSDLPFNQFFQDLSTEGIFALVDVVFGDREANRSNTVTGSTVVGFQYPCNQSNCAHIELATPNWLGGTFLNGKQWISGNSQWVPGGNGCLAGVEPTGRHPFGNAFKVVLTNTDEASGRADFGIYFHFSIFCGETPYLIGPFPWMSQYEKDVIFLGIT